MSAESSNPVRIQVFKNGDENFEGKRYNITQRLFKNWEQLLTEVSNIGLKKGAVRKLYTMTGAEVKKLSELQDQQQYVASSGEAFIKCTYLLEKRRVSYGNAEKVKEEVVQEKCVFTPDSKGIRVYVYIEGNPMDAPKRLVLNYRNSKSFGSMLSFLSEELKANDGTIKLLFDASNLSQIVSMDDFYDGVNIIAIANSKIVKPREKFRYPIVTNEKGSSSVETVLNQKSQKAQDIKAFKDVVKSENIFEFGGKSIRIFAHLSGFDMLKPKPVVLNWKNCKNFEQFLNILSFTLKPREGPVRSVFEMNVKSEIKDLSILTEGLNVVCVSKTLEKYPLPGNYQLQSIQSSRPGTANGRAQKIITVFPNGDSQHTGLKITVSEFRFNNVEKLLDLINQQIKVNMGKMSVLYELSDNSKPRKMLSIQEILSSNGDCFVSAVSIEPFRNIKYNSNSVESKQKSIQSVEPILKTSKAKANKDPVHPNVPEVPIIEEL